MAVLHINLDALCAAVDEARIKAAGTPWAARVEDAYEHLLSVDSVEYDEATGELTYVSESGKTYTANGECHEAESGEPCKAWGHGIPCKHRCAARIVRNLLAKQKEAPREVVTMGSRLARARKALVEVNELFS